MSGSYEKTGFGALLVVNRWIAASKTCPPVEIYIHRSIKIVTSSVGEHGRRGGKSP